MAAIFFHLITLDGRRLFTGSSALVLLGTANRKKRKKEKKRLRKIELKRSSSLARRREREIRA
jgi:hypothetical protein